MNTNLGLNRRAFLRNSGLVAGAALCNAPLLRALAPGEPAATPKVSAHLWVYASAHPPDWDGTPDFERAFSDLQFSGFDGVELMAVNLRHPDAVEHIGGLSARYRLPITGSSFGADMWDEKEHDAIVKDAALVIDRLSQLKGKTFGLSVGDAKHVKTDAEIDQQVVVLKEIFAMCDAHGIVGNLHNHTYEVQNGMHDLKGTLARIPDARLGPDLNWLIRGGVDPVTFIRTYGRQMVYVHLRDQYANGIWTEYLGQGATDFPAIAAALKAVHFQGRAAVELAFPDKFVPTQPLSKTWKDSRDFVRKTFGW
jgi:sugar phosphate isomerase/epimerase